MHLLKLHECVYTVCMNELQKLYQAIIEDPKNDGARAKNWLPIYAVHPSAKIVIIGQAPGRLAQESGIPWDDPSGRNLRNWLGVSDDVFYDKSQISLLPMDFYFPGSAARGDIAPRKGFAEKWHGQILAQMPNIELTLLIGGYAQNYYLPDTKKTNLTETVRNFKDYLPHVFPLVHPSPRNNIWHKKNPWFKDELVRVLQASVAEVLGG